MFSDSLPLFPFLDSRYMYFMHLSLKNNYMLQSNICIHTRKKKKSYCLHSKKYHKSITLEWLEFCQRVIAQCTKNEKIVQQ